MYKYRTKLIQFIIPCDMCGKCFHDEQYTLSRSHLSRTTPPNPAFTAGERDKLDSTLGVSVARLWVEREERTDTYRGSGCSSIVGGRKGDTRQLRPRCNPQL
jgi:hypothetical protein